MTKHDRLINALTEIKETCAKNADDDFGCGRRCPFLMGKDGDKFRPCEIIRFTTTVFGEPPACVPEEWAGSVETRNNSEETCNAKLE